MSKKKEYTSGPTGDLTKKEYIVTDYETVVEPSDDKTSEKDIIEEFMSRFNKMESGRNIYENDWDVCDGQMEANTYYDEMGKLMVNIPVEQSLVELACGRFAGKLNYKLEPVGRQPDVDEMTSSKYALQYFVRKENVHKTIKRLRRLRAQYGTCIAQTAITIKTKKVYDIDNTKENNPADGIRTDKEFIETTETEFKFGPKIIPIRHFRIDERALNQPEIQEAEDCIVQESISLEELKLRRGKNTSFSNIDDVTTMMDDERAISDKSTTYDNQCQIYYYYNQMNQNYWIIGNKNILLFRGKIVSKSRRLPIRTCQHYSDENNFYGRGICHKVRYSKAYKSEIFQDMLDQIRMTGSSILVGNDNNIAGHTFAGPSEMSIIQFTGALDKVQQVNFDPNIQKYQVILDTLDNMIIQDTGENLKATYQETAGQLGTVEIIEQNRLTRLSTTDENDDTFIGEVLTDMLNNITQFAPKLLKTITKTKEGEVDTVVRPTITIPNVKVSDRSDEVGKPKYEFVEDQGQFGYFELTDTLIQSQYLVQVITNSNMNVQKVLDKNSFTQYIQNRSILLQTNPALAQSLDANDELSYMKMLYDIDDKMVSDTKKSKTKKENQEIMDRISNFIGATTDDQTNQDAIGIKAQSDDPTNATGVFPDATGTTAPGIQGPNGLS